MPCCGTITMQSNGGNQQKCIFYVEKRKRNCQFKAAKGFQYCGEHAFHSDQPTKKPRIPCPLDPAHSVYASQLKKHLRICNSRPVERPVYYVKSINIDTTDERYMGKKDLASFTPSDILEIIRKLREVQEANLVDFEESIQHHESLKGELCLESNGPSARKHLEQLSSILGNMEVTRLFAPDHCYIEYGAGKGRLSQWIFDAAADYPGTHFILVDKKNVRHKRDLHHKEVRQKLSMERIKIDIQDLDLTKVPAIKENPGRPVIAYCKHLCGAATDLALRSLFPRHSDSSQSLPRHLQIRGVAMATCCHHCCNWASYVGKGFLGRHGFDRADFEALIRLSSWSVCGSRDKSGAGEAERESHSQVETGEGKETLTSALGLTIPEREEVGELAKRLLDAGRMEFLIHNGMMGRAALYVKKEITLQNTMLIATNGT